MKNPIFSGAPILITILCLNCQIKNNQDLGFTEGTFGYDIQFLKKHYPDLAVIQSGKSAIAVAPEIQGRIMTSTADGDQGASYGWINHGLIKSGQISKHFNPFGGEERFWLGPEGGQFSIYFKSGDPFDLDHWYVPKVIDTEPFDLIRRNDNLLSFRKKASLINYSDFRFDFEIERNITILSKPETELLLETKIPENIKFVGMQSENVLKNDGTSAWTQQTGMLSIWILSMLRATENTVVVIPFKGGAEEDLGPVVNDNYFGPVPPGRLVISDSILYFKTDAQYRSKIGIPPRRAKRIMGSYDPMSNLLTIAHFTLDPEDTLYVNSKWEIQKEPFRGDVVNAYNDGDTGAGQQLGNFYELESSSPAANLSPGEKMVHRHSTFHFAGSEGGLDSLTNELLGVRLKDIKNAFN